MTNVGSKFHLRVGLNLPHPAKCFSCGRGPKHEEDVFVDFDRSVEFYGAVLYCIDCAQEMARTIEYGPLAEKALIEAELVEAQVFSKSVEERMKGVLEGVRSFMGDVVVDAIISDVFGKSDDVPDDEAADSLVAEIEQRTNDKNSGS